MFHSKIILWQGGDNGREIYLPPNNVILNLEILAWKKGEDNVRV